MPYVTVFDGQRRVVVFELPHLFGQREVTFFHEQLVFGVVDGQTLSTAAVPQLFGLQQSMKKENRLTKSNVKKKKKRSKNHDRRPNHGAPRKDHEHTVRSELEPPLGFVPGTRAQQGRVHTFNRYIIYVIVCRLRRDRQCCSDVKCGVKRVTGQSADTENALAGSQPQ